LIFRTHQRVINSEAARSELMSLLTPLIAGMCLFAGLASVASAENLGFAFTIIDFAIVATGINNVGQIVGCYEGETGGILSFFYRSGTFTTVDYPAIKDAGQIVGTVRSYFGNGGSPG